MNHKDQLRDLAMTVNNGLTSYIAVHDAIFEEAATVKSFFKNLFGQGVPMSKLLENAEALEPLWDDLCKNVKAFRKAHYGSLSTDERHFFDILSRYVAALRETIGRLVDRQRLMNRGSPRGPNNPMSLEATKQKERHYQVAVQEYMAIAQELNAAFSIVFDDERSLVEAPEMRSMELMTERQASELFVHTMIRQVREAWPGLFSQMRDFPSVVDIAGLDQESAQWEMILAATALDIGVLRNLFSKEQAERLLTLTIQCFPEEERDYALSTFNEYNDRYDKDLASGLNPMLAIGEILYGRWGLAGDCYRPGELFVAPDQIFAAGLAVPLPSFVGVWKRIKTNYSLTAD